MDKSVSQTMGKADWAMLLSLSVLWGGSFFFVEVALQAIPPLSLVAYRVAIAAVFLWIFAFATRRSLPRSRTVWAAFAIMGLLNNVIPFTLIVWGQTQIASGLASILNATTPIFTVVVAGMFLRDERATKLKLAGVAAGFLGVVVLIGPAAFSSLGFAVFAQLAILLAAISYAFAGVFGRRFNEMGIDPVVVAAGQVMASALFLLPIAALFDDSLAPGIVEPVILGSVLGLAILSTSLAYVLYFRLLSSAGATNLLLVTFLIPATAIMLGVGVLGETLNWNHILGMSIIGLALTAIDGRLWRRLAGSQG